MIVFDVFRGQARVSIGTGFDMQRSSLCFYCPRITKKPATKEMDANLIVVHLRREFGAWKERLKEEAYEKGRKNGFRKGQKSRRKKK